MSWLASRRAAPTLIRILLLGLAGWFVIQTATSQPASLEDEFPKTDFSNSVVDFDEIQSGGPPRDGIPALEGQRLDPMPGGIHFAFAWLAFRPDTSLYGR